MFVSAYGSPIYYLQVSAVFIPLFTKFVHSLYAEKVVYTLVDDYHDRIYCMFYIMSIVIIVIMMKSAFVVPKSRVCIV